MSPEAPSTCIFRRILSHNPTILSPELSASLQTKGIDTDFLNKKEPYSWTSFGKRLFGIASEKASRAISSYLANDWLSETSPDFQKVLDKFSDTNSPEFLDEFLTWSHYRLAKVFYDCGASGSDLAFKYLLERGFFPTLLPGKFAQICPLNSPPPEFQPEEGPLNICVKMEQNSLFASLQAEFGHYIPETISSKIGTYLTKTGIYSKTIFNDTVIHIICRLGNIECLKHLLKDLITKPFYVTAPILPIHEAASAGEIDCLTELLSMPKYMPETSQFQLPKHSCVLNGLPAIYHYPFCIDQVNENGLTPFLLSVLQGHLDCVETLTKFHVKAERVEPDEAQGGLDHYRTERAEEVGYEGDELETVSEDEEKEGEEAKEDEEEDTSTEEEDFNWCRIITTNEATAVISHSRAVCPIDLARRVYLAWDPLASQITVTPISHPDQAATHSICGYFGALHMAVMRRDLEMVCFLLNYLNADVSSPGIPCLHESSSLDVDSLLENSNLGQIYVAEGLRKKTKLDEFSLHQMRILDRVVSSTPLGLACTLREAQLSLTNLDQTILQIVRVLLIAGAKDFHHVLLKQACDQGDFELVSCLLSARSHSQVFTDHTQVKDQSLIVDWSGTDLDYASERACDLQPSNAIEIKFRTWLEESCWFAEVKSTIEGPISGLPHEAISDLLLKPMESQSGLENLTKLSLSSCNLRSLPLCLFTRLPAIRHLNASENQLARLPESLPLDELSCVASNTCTIWCSELLCFDLSDNRLKDVPTWLFDNTLTYGKTSMPQVRFAPNLNSLILAGNQLRALPKQMWFNRTITYLDASRNQLTSLPTISMSQLLKANFSGSRRNRTVSSTRRDQVSGILSNVSFPTLFILSQMRDCSLFSKENELIPCPEDQLKCIYGNEKFLSQQIDMQGISNATY
ncbi:hypothetical protein Ciccas_009926 [Cichlidogyrus casuarinus]|uniref:Uncharacterized protein n=1 Tax=Cichlidogyrus casuarinus TaxID=1844966 RepID=A0ABD2PVV1_9PLAT